VGQQIAVTAWSVAVGFIALLVVFRGQSWRTLLREGEAARAQTGGAD
jgi:hypothetical protein